MPRTVLARPAASLLVLLLAGFVAGAARAPGPLQADAHTLLLAHFDGSPRMDAASQPVTISGDAEVIPDGRFGGALRVTPPTRLSVEFPPDLTDPRAGAIEFWIRPAWSGGDGVAHRILIAPAGEKRLLAVNESASGKLVGVVSSMAGGRQVARSVSGSVAQWKAGTWHHVTLSWQAGTLRLWLDGRLASSVQGAIFPSPGPYALRFRGSGFDIDELRVSNVARNPSGSPAPAPAAAGKPAARAASSATEAASPATEAARFVEPPGAYRLRGSFSPDASGMKIVALPGLEAFDPEHPEAASAGASIHVAAAAGEVVPARAVVMASRSQPGLEAVVSELRDASGARIPPAAIQIRRVVRAPGRRYSLGGNRSTVLADRFLPRWRPLDLGAHQFREIWLTIHVPANAAPGAYQGRLDLSSEGRNDSVGLEVQVYPFTLTESSTKSVGICFLMADELVDAAAVRRDLADLRAHDVRVLYTDLAVSYFRKGDTFVPDVGALTRGLELIRDAGFDSTVVVGTGLDRLARDLGHGRVGDTGLDSDLRFLTVARSGMEALLHVIRQFPDLRIYGTHMDEIFDKPGKLERYIALSRAAHQVRQVPLYATYSMAGSSDRLRPLVAPYVNLANIHGRSFELWILRGHSMAAYSRELRANAQRAWFYHNRRGSWFTPEWERIISGIYLWASPFDAHTPWAYRYISGSPFVDTDGNHRDFIMALPDPSDPNVLIPTPLWEGLRQGGEDLRYLATLERAIREHGSERPAAAAAARSDLDRLRRLITQAGVHSGGSDPAPDSSRGLDLDSPLVVHRPTDGGPDDAPIIHALAVRFSDGGMDALRARLARDIEALTSPK